MCIKCFACSDSRQTPNLFSNAVKTGEEKDLQIFQQIKTTWCGGVCVGLRVLTSQHVVSIEREKPSHRTTLSNKYFISKKAQSINKRDARKFRLSNRAISDTLKPCDGHGIEWKLLEKPLTNGNRALPPRYFFVSTHPNTKPNLSQFVIEILNRGIKMLEHDEVREKRNFPPEKHNLQNKFRHNQDIFKWWLFRHVSEVG